MRKRIKQRDKKTHVAVAILASFVMFSSILSPVSVDTQVKAAEKTAGSWEELQKTLGELSANSTMTIKLTGDLIFPDAEAGAGAEDTGEGAEDTGAGAEDTGEGADETGEGADETAGDSDAQSEEKKTDIKPIIINNSLKITLDLNGHTIDRGLKGKGRVADGYVIKVAEKASLTVTDTSEKPGLITGGANEGNGGGILCEPNSSLTIDGGVNIRDNEAENGGGIYIDNGDDVRIGSCTIWGNIAAKNGGGIYGGTADVAFLGGLTKIKNNIGPDEKDNDFYITKGMSKLRFWVYADAKKLKKKQTSEFKRASRIGILLEEMKKEISDGYGKVNSIEASVYFFYNTGDYIISRDRKKSEITIERDQERIRDLTKTLLEIYDDEGSLKSSKEYGSFISALSAAQSSTGERIIILGGDYSSDDPIEIKGTVTIDLNGHYIKRDRDYETKKNGSVIIINKDATLTIKDSRPKVKGYDGVKGGVIAGGASTNGGGGITIKEDGHLIMKGGTIYDCVSDEDGGGVYMDTGSTSTSFKMTGGRIYNCRTLDSTDECFGGGIFLGDGELDIRDASIENCYTEDDGGAIFCRRGKLYMQNVLFSGNKAMERGGAIYIDLDLDTDHRGTQVYATGCSFFNNESGEDGGALCVRDNPKHQGFVAFDRCVFKKNVAGEDGGAICQLDDALVLSSCEITNNTAGEQGGGVYVDARYDINIKGLMIIKNNTSKESYKYADLFLEDSGVHTAYVFSGGLSPGSWIGIGTDDDDETRLSTNFDVYEFKYIHPASGVIYPKGTDTVEVAMAVTASIFSTGNWVPIVIIGGACLLVLLFVVIYKKKGAAYDME